MKRNYGPSRKIEVEQKKREKREAKQAKKASEPRCVVYGAPEHNTAPDNGS